MLHFFPPLANLHEVCVEPVCVGVRGVTADLLTWDPVSLIKS